MFTCEQTYIKAQYCTTSTCTLPTLPGHDVETGKLYRIEYADVINNGLCSVSYLCRC